MIRNNRRKDYSMRERVSYHEGRSSAGGSKGAYSKGYVKGARMAANKARQYYGNKGGNKNA